VDVRNQRIYTASPFRTAVASAPSPLGLVLDRGTRVTGRTTHALLHRDVDGWAKMPCYTREGRRSMLLWAIVGGVVIGVVLLDAFETIVLPQRATRRLRLARLVLRSL
jgi:hypothetical protein